MEDQDGVGLRGVQLAVRLVGQRDRAQLLAAFQRQLVGRIGEGEVLRLDDADAAWSTARLSATQAGLDSPGIYAGRFLQRLVDVGLDVLDVLQADGYADVVRRDAGRLLLLRRSTARASSRPDG